MKPKKNSAEVGMVLRKLSSADALKPWASHVGGPEAADATLARWSSSGLAFFVALRPKAAKHQGFDYEDGLIAYAVDNGRALLSQAFSAALPEGDGGYIAVLSTKVRHKIVGKYLLTAAERAISEKHAVVFATVAESDASAQRLYKAAGYEEVSRATAGANPAMILYKKNLS